MATSAALLRELADVVDRPRLAIRIPPQDAALLGTMYAESGLFFEPGPDPGRCRDPRDDYLLALAESSQADYLVTRDEDLLVLERHGKTQIIYPAQFLQILSGVAP